MNFQQELKIFSKPFDSYSKQYFLEKIDSAKKYAPLISDFYKNLFDFTVGGKKLRAYLVQLGYRIGKGSPFVEVMEAKKILPICLAVEIIHSFLLIHDDIIDKSDKRRGKLTIHKRYEKYRNSHYGISCAILLGDIASFEALDLVNSSGYGDELKIICQKKLYLSVFKEWIFC